MGGHKERVKRYVPPKDKPAQPGDRLPRSVREQLAHLGARSLADAKGIVVFDASRS